MKCEQVYVRHQVFRLSRVLSVSMSLLFSRKIVKLFILLPTRSTIKTISRCSRSMETSIGSIVKIFVYWRNYFSITKPSITMWSRFSSTSWRGTMPMVAIFSAISPKRSIAHRNTIFRVSWSCLIVNDVAMDDSSSNSVTFFHRKNTKLAHQNDRCRHMGHRRTKRIGESNSFNSWSSSMTRDERAACWKILWMIRASPPMIFSIRCRI